jgi:transposase
MAMGKRESERQDELWIPTADLPEAPGHPFYRRLNQLLADGGFDGFVEGLCGRYYHESLGRPGIPPGVYFRMLLIGFFEGIDSERGIAWRCADSLGLRKFLGYALTDTTPDHSSLSVIRHRIDLETHEEVFGWVLKLLATKGLLKGKTIGVDATTLEANAAMRSIIRKDTGESYVEFLTGLAKASGIQTPTREALAKLDRKRKKKASNQDWENPHDPDAKITKMKDGRTHLAHKAEHAVDMDSQAIVAVTLQPADRGDTDSLDATVQQAVSNLLDVQIDPATEEHVHKTAMEEVVTDKGYHSNEAMADLSAMVIRSYVSEPDRGRRVWTDEQTGEVKSAERDAVYANRRRIRGKRGKALMRKRGEVLERTFAHCYETGGMRRTHLRGHPNILKRLLIHVCGFNLGLVMRAMFGIGKPRRAQDGLGGVLSGILALLGRLLSVPRAFRQPWSFFRHWFTPSEPTLALPTAA